MDHNKITRNLSVSAGAMRKSGPMVGRSWGEYQATGGYHPAARPHNPTPSDMAQEKCSTKVTEVYKTVPNRTKTNVYKQTRYGS